MSSGGWELVGKNKKDKNYSKTAKLTKAEKKKFTQNAPKVEDFRKYSMTNLILCACIIYLFSIISALKTMYEQFFIFQFYF